LLLLLLLRGWGAERSAHVRSNGGGFDGRGRHADAVQACAAGDAAGL
jgi:hypothetical protein